MASSNNKAKEDLKDILTCSKCDNIFKHPKALPCFHVFCQDCLKKFPEVESNTKKGINCFKCQLFWEVGQYESEYLLEELVNLYNWDESNKSQNCNICDNKKMKWQCVNCNFDMCEECKEHHTKIPTCRNHLISEAEKESMFVVNKPVFCKLHENELVQFYCTTCDNIICIKCFATIHAKHDIKTTEEAEIALKKTVQTDLEAITKLIQEHQDCVSEMDKQISEVKEDFNKVKREVQNKRSAQKSKIDDEYNGEYKSLTTKENTNISKLTATKLQHEELSKDKMHLVILAKAALNNSKGTSLLKELTTGLKKKVEDISKVPIPQNKVTLVKPSIKRDDIEIIEKKKEDIKQAKRISVTTQTSQCLYNEFIPFLIYAAVIIMSFVITFLFIALMIVHDDNKALSKQNMRLSNSLSFTDCERVTSYEFINSKYVQGNITDILMKISSNDTKPLNTFQVPYANKLTLVNKELWLPRYSTVDVVSIFGEKIRDIHLHVQQKVNYVLQVNSSELFMASDKGLFILNTAGEVQYKLADGDFVDVGMNQHLVVAVEYDNLQILTFQYDNIRMKWKRIDTISFLCEEKPHVARTVVDNQNIYLSLYYGIVIKKYNIQSLQLLETYTTNWYRTYSPMLFPLVFFTDIHESLLVYDDHHDIVATLTKDGKWAKFSFHNVKKIKDIIVDDQHIYILSNCVIVPHRICVITKYLIEQP